MTRDYLKQRNWQNTDEEKLDEVDKAWMETEKPDVEDALRKHPWLKWFLIIVGGAIVIIVIGCLIARAMSGEFSSSRKVTTNRIKEDDFSNQTEVNLDNSEDNTDPETDTDTEDYNTNPEITANNYNSQEPQSTYYGTGETATSEHYSVATNNQDDTNSRYEANEARTCTYRALYGEKTPTELANESYMVKYYYDNYIVAEQNYQQTARMYANSTSNSFHQKITQAEFARSKAYALYEKELSEKKAEYEDMLNECQ